MTLKYVFLEDAMGKKNLDDVKLSSKDELDSLGFVLIVSTILMIVFFIRGATDWGYISLSVNIIFFFKYIWKKITYIPEEEDNDFEN